MKIAMPAALLFILALTTTAIAAAQQPADPPPAQIPTQIFSARKVFISNTSAILSVPKGSPETTYNEFYAALKNWGRYELVSSPADADMVLEISFDSVRIPQDQYRIRMLILDPKTHVALWPIVEAVTPWAREATGRKNFDQAMASLVNNLKKLVTPPSSTPAT